MQNSHTFYDTYPTSSVMAVTVKSEVDWFMVPSIIMFSFVSKHPCRLSHSGQRGEIIVPFSIHPNQDGFNIYIYLPENKK